MTATEAHRFVNEVMLDVIANRLIEIGPPEDRVEAQEWIRERREAELDRERHEREMEELDRQMAERDKQILQYRMQILFLEAVAMDTPPRRLSRRHIAMEGE